MAGAFVKTDTPASLLSAPNLCAGNLSVSDKALLVLWEVGLKCRMIHSIGHKY